MSHVGVDDPSSRHIHRSSVPAPGSNVSVGVDGFGRRRPIVDDRLRNGGGNVSQRSSVAAATAVADRRRSAAASTTSAAYTHRPSSGGRRHRTPRTRDSGDELLEAGRDEVIQVDIEPQDDAWGDNTTCVTGNTSERSTSLDDLSRAGKEFVEPRLLPGAAWGDTSSCDGPVGFFSRSNCVRCCSFGLAAFICFLAFISPILMVTIPKVAPLIPKSNSSHVSVGQTTDGQSLLSDWSVGECLADCQGCLIGFSVKCLILLIGSWALFARRFSTETMPRLFLAKWLVLAFIFIFIFAYWLFYIVRIIQKRENDFDLIVRFAQSMLDSLLFVHYLAVILFELSYNVVRPEYKIHVLRSPDGESKVYNCSLLSVQMAAVFVLRRYSADFIVYNPFLERLPTSAVARLRKASRSSVGGSVVSGPVSSFKVYDLDQEANDIAASAPSAVAARAIMAATARKRDSAHNDRFYDELEWERRVRKRRARLVTAAEEAFGHVKRLNDEKAPCTPMDSFEAAQNVFASLARSLQKYLRVTRQQPRHTADQVIRHLAQCLSFDVSPKAFLERFFTHRETLDAAQFKIKWSIACEWPVNRHIGHGTVFQLRCHCPGPDAGVSLLCSVSRLPYLDLTEEPVDFKFDNKFVLRLSSETSV